MENSVSVRFPSIYRIGYRRYRRANRNKKYDIFNHIIKNSVFEGSNLTWYYGLVRDSQQLTNYREVN